jgi:predicted  nucleic acid-binding Zn-ribbon protein
MEEIEKEILELEKELKSLKDEHQVIEKFFKKGMDGNKFRELMAQKNELEKFIAEVEVELEIVKTELNNLKDEK